MTRRGGRLSWQLIRVGLAAGRSTPGDRLRWWGLFAAAAALALVTMATVTAFATYEGREARAQARGPVLGESRKGATLMVHEAFDTVGDVQHSVLYVYPLKADAPPPPGLSAWPEPGQAVLSPELVHQERSAGIRERYGTFSGTIAKDGLVSPTERLAYVRLQHPPDTKQSIWLYAHGYGSRSLTVEILNQRPLGPTVLTLWSLVGLPALALTVIAARVGSHARDRRGALLHALGGAWWHRSLVGLAEAAIPAALGTLTGLIPFAIGSTWDVRLPPTGYSLDSTDLRTAWPSAVAGLVVCLLLTLAVVVGSQRLQRDGASTRPRPLSSSIPVWRLIACGVGIAIVVSSQYVDRRQSTVVFCTGTVLMWAFLPSVAAVAARRAGVRLASHGLRTGRAGQIIGGRWTASHPGVIVRLAVAMVIGLGIIAQVQVWNSRLGEAAQAARATAARAGDRVIEVNAGVIPASRAHTFARSLPEGSLLLKKTTRYNDAGEQRTLLQGSCDALRALGQSCSAGPEDLRAKDRRVEEILRWNGTGTRVQVADELGTHGGEDSFLVITPTSGELPAVKQAAYTLPAVAEPIGGSWLSGAATKERLNNWILLFGASGLGILVIAAGVSAASEFMRMRHTLSPVTVLTGTRSIFRSVAWWHLSFPLLICTAISAVVTSWHSVFFIAVVGQGSVSWAVLASATIGCALLSVAVGTLGARSAIRAARQWGPTAD